MYKVSDVTHHVSSFRLITIVECNPRLSLCSDFSTTMAEGAEESQKKVMVRLTVKTAKEKQVVEVDEDAGVKEVR